MLRVTALRLLDGLLTDDEIVEECVARGLELAAAQGRAGYIVPSVARREVKAAIRGFKSKRLAKVV